MSSLPHVSIDRDIHAARPMKACTKFHRAGQQAPPLIFVLLQRRFAMLAVLDRAAGVTGTSIYPNQRTTTYILVFVVSCIELMRLNSTKKLSHDRTSTHNFKATIVNSQLNQF